MSAQSFTFGDAAAGVATFVGLWSIAAVLLTVGWIVERASGDPLFPDDEGGA